MSALVYVMGPRGACPQVWHDPMVTPAGKLAVIPAGLEIVAGPFPLPERPRWTVGEAEAFCNTGNA